MTTRTFAQNNPNYDALVIPTQEGGTEDDGYFGDIGDATMSHIQGLTQSQRQMWDELYHGSNGAIFRFESSTESNDLDIFSLSGKDLDKELNRLRRNTKGQFMSNEQIVGLKEAIEEEKKRREESNCPYDKADIGEASLYPYHLMEQYPGMEKHIEMPTTPKNRACYMGNTTQMFYDEFSEGHPDSKLMNTVINMLNRPWDQDVDKGYGNWMKELVGSSKYAREYVKTRLCQLITKFVENEGKADLEQLVKDYLVLIDNDYQIEYKNEAARKTQKDPMFMLLVYKSHEWDSKAQEGMNVYSEVKSFGRILFQEYRSQMRGHHWKQYRMLKRKFAPAVIIRGININRCNLLKLQTALQATREEASKIYLKRPFESIGQMYSNGLIGKKTFSDKVDLIKVNDFIEKQMETAIKNADLQRCSKISQALVKGQRENKLDLTREDWNMVWVYYRIMKQETMKEINAKR